MSTLWPGLDGPVISYISKPPQNLPPLRRLAVLGSTGSIGRNALDVARNNPGALKIAALAGGRNRREMARQAREFRPPRIAMQSSEVCGELAATLGYAPQFTAGAEAYAQMAALEDVDMVVSAQSGGLGLAATLAAVLAGKTVCLANKESLVLAGPLLREIAAKSGASILPIDSEHNAIFQCLAGRGQDIAKIILTASGGPFFGKTRAELASIGPEDALRHPNWQMGPKITVDSSTMMNKTLELIEAIQLFGVSPDMVEILIQPQSIIHSMVRLADGSVLAQLASPDMRLPIAFCLLWPNTARDAAPELDFTKTARLDFARPDEELFPALPLGREALAASPRTGLSAACVVLNAANEICVELFLNRRIAWADIARHVGKALKALGGAQLPATALPDKFPSSPGDIASLAFTMSAEIMRLDHAARDFVLKAVAGQKE